MEEIKYIKDDDGWKRVVETKEDIPDEYKDNYYYRNKRQSTKSEVETKNEQQKRRGKIYTKRERCAQILSIALIIILCLIIAMLAFCLIVCLSPDSQYNDFVNTVVGFVVYGILQVLMFIYKIFYGICCAIFDTIYGWCVAIGI